MSIIDRAVHLQLTASPPAADSDAHAAGLGLSRPAALSRRPVMRTIHDRAQSAARGRLRHLRAVVLLDGSVRKTPLTDAIGRSLLELPVERDRTLLDLWRNDVCSLVFDLGLDSL